MAGTQKIVNLGLMIGAAGLFLFLSRLVGLVWNLASLPRMSEWLVRPHDLIGFVLVAGTFVYVRRLDTANTFLNEAVTELSKVTWPNRQETVASTGVSCILVAICALILLGFDSLWGVVLQGMFNL